jgi:cation transporter-like permease
LNPDNVVIPLITTTSDTVATLVINPVLYIIRMMGLF